MIIPNHTLRTNGLSPNIITSIGTKIPLMQQGDGVRTDSMCAHFDGAKADTPGKTKEHSRCAHSAEIPNQDPQIGHINDVVSVDLRDRIARTECADKQTQVGGVGDPFTVEVRRVCIARIDFLFESASSNFSRWRILPTIPAGRR